MSDGVRVTGVFAEFGPFIEALKRLRLVGVRRFDVYSPVPLTGREDLLPRADSPVRWWALGAGIIGSVGGFALCIGSTRLFSLIVSGKPIVSWLPYCVIAFELTILTVGLVTMGAALLHSGLRPQRVRPAYDPEFSVGAFGISVPCTEDQRSAMARLLREAGAGRVREDLEPAPSLWAQLLRPTEAEDSPVPPVSADAPSTDPQC